MDIRHIPNEEFESLGRKIPDPHFVFYKKNRMVVDYNTTVQQLRYSRGWTGRFFAWGVRFGYKNNAYHWEEKNSEHHADGTLSQPDEKYVETNRRRNHLGST